MTDRTTEEILKDAESSLAQFYDAPCKYDAFPQFQNGVIAELAAKLTEREREWEYKSAFIFMCEVWEELDTLRTKLITQKDKTTVQDKLVMEWPMIQGTRNQMNLRKIAKIPYDKAQVAKAVKQALSIPPKKED